MSLEICGARFAYRRLAVLDGVYLTVPRGRLVGLLGPNGAGKSTLLRCICRVLRPAAGTFSFDQRDLHALSRRDLAREVAFLPQSTPPPFSLTVADSVMLGRTPHLGLRPARRDWLAVQDSIERFGLGPLAQRNVAELSGGQLQRVLLARAIAQEPSVLLLDEPTGALDLRHQIETMELLHRLVVEESVVAVMAIHDLNMAARFCHDLALLHDGRVVASGKPAAVLTAGRVQEAYGIEVEVRVLGGVPRVWPASSVRCGTASP